MITGINRSTGTTLTGIEHIKQSIADIIMTPIGSRVMRRDYGSLVFDLIDAPLNNTYKLRLAGSVAIAILKWEKRVKIKKINILIENGKIILDMDFETKEIKGSAFNESSRLTLPLT